MLKQKDASEIQSEVLKYAEEKNIVLFPTTYKKLFFKFAKKKGFDENDCLNADKALAFEKLAEKSIRAKSEKINDIYTTMENTTEKLIIHLNEGKKALDDSIDEIKNDGLENKDTLSKKMDKFLSQYSNFMKQVGEIKENIDSLEDSLKSVDDLSIQDSVTMLGNCRYFEMAFDGEMYTTKRYNTPTTLVLFRMKNIAQIRKKFSQSAENAIVKSLANLIHESIRASDVLCRCDDESFRILLHNTDVEDAKKLVEKIKQILNKVVFQKGEDKFKISFLYGLTQIRKEDTPSNAIMRITLNS